MDIVVGDGRVSERVGIDKLKQGETWQTEFELMCNRRQVAQRVAPESHKSRADDFTVRPRHTFASKTDVYWLQLTEIVALGDSS